MQLASYQDFHMHSDKTSFVATKGQTISKANYAVLNSPKNDRWISTSKITTSRLVQKRVYLLAKRR